MALFALLLLAAVGGSLYYLLNSGKRGTDTRVMREFYGCSEGETLAGMWPNGLLWLRPVRYPETAIQTTHDGPGVAMEVRVASVYETLALSLTTDGVFILVDNRREDNIGTLRFSRQDIRAVTRLPAETDLAASRLGREEAACNVALYLKTGESYWIQIPESAYHSLTQTDPSVMRHSNH